MALRREGAPWVRTGQMQEPLVLGQRPSVLQAESLECTLPKSSTAMWFAFLAQKITAEPETHLRTCGFLCCVALVT